MNLYESINSKLNEYDDTLKQLIKDEFGFDIKYLDYRSDEFAKHKNLNAFIRRCLQEAKEIGLDVDEISFGYPGVGDNYVGNHDSKIVITDDVNSDGTLLRKELPSNLDLINSVSTTALGKQVSVDEEDHGFIHAEANNYAIEGYLDEFIALYYWGTDRKTALQLMQSIK